MNNQTERNTMAVKAAAVCKEAALCAHNRFYDRFHYDCFWPRGSVEDRKIWIKDYHHAKKILLRAANI